MEIHRAKPGVGGGKELHSLMHPLGHESRPGVGENILVHQVVHGLGYEHAVVNMFLIPAGMLLGAKTTASAWWMWNQIPVTLGNFVGGFVFTGLALYVTYRTRVPRTERIGDVAGAPAAGD